MKQIKQILVIVVCLTMLFSLTGCSFKGGEAAVTDADPGMVYEAEYGYLDGSIVNLLIHDGMLYGSDYSYDEKTQIVTCNLARWNLNTMEKEEVLYTVNGGSIDQMAKNGNGTFFLLVNDSEKEKSGYYLVVLDENGENQSEFFIGDLIDSCSTEPGSAAYPRHMTVDDAGNIYLYVSGQDGTLLVLDSEGNRKFGLSGQGGCLDMITGRDGIVYVAALDDISHGSSHCLKAVDTANQTWGDTYRGIPEGLYGFAMQGEDETHILISFGDTLYRYDLTTRTAETVLNWLDYDINTDLMQEFAVLEDGRILAFSGTMTGGTSRIETVLLAVRNASEKTDRKEKKTITYGTLNLSMEMKDKIIEFNKTNKEYRIVVKDYAVTEDSGVYDHTASVNAFNMDLAAGNIPDLIDLTDLNFMVYAGKGVFADLNTFLENDNTISREDLVSNPLTIYETAGNLYGIPVSFYIQTWMGRTSVLHGKTGWTVQDIREIMAEQPEGTEFMYRTIREFVMWDMICYQLDQYIDWDTGTCSFDGENFISILEFLHTFPSADELNYGDSDGLYTCIHEGKVLVTEEYVRSVRGFLTGQARYDNDDVTYIGYPTADGSNGSLIVGCQPLAISASSENPAGAWAFIRSLLSEEYQGQIGELSFPVLQSALDRCLESAMEEPERKEVSWSDDFYYELVPATQEQIDMLTELIDTARPANSSADIGINRIIAEEVSAFFTGQKSAEDVADIIQSRVSIYVSEND